MFDDPYLAPGTPSARHFTATFECMSCGCEFDADACDELGACEPDPPIDECPVCGRYPWDYDEPKCACGQEMEWNMEHECWQCPECGAP